MDDPKAYDGLSALVFLVGIYEGVVPLVVRLVFRSDGGPLLALPQRLPAPWWWIVSVTVLVATAVALGLIDQAKERAFPDES
jgi:hypothetical protein